MSQNKIAHNCDFLEIRNSLPVCTHPERSKTSQFCHPFDLACEDATFEKIFTGDPLGRDEEPPADKKCILCVHYCQAQITSDRDFGKRCGSHKRSEACKFKATCKAIVRRPDARSGFCILHNKEILWWKSCPCFLKGGDCHG